MAAFLWLVPGDGHMMAGMGYREKSSIGYTLIVDHESVLCYTWYQTRGTLRSDSGIVLGIGWKDYSIKII